MFGRTPTPSLPANGDLSPSDLHHHEIEDVKVGLFAFRAGGIVGVLFFGWLVHMVFLADPLHGVAAASPWLLLVGFFSTYMWVRSLTRELVLSSRGNEHLIIAWGELHGVDLRRGNEWTTVAASARYVAARAALPNPDAGCVHTTRTTDGVPEPVRVRWSAERLLIEPEPDPTGR